MIYKENDDAGGEVRTKDFSEGRVVNHRYEIGGKIGEGSTASVYRVWDLHLERYLALKVIAGNTADVESKNDIDRIAMQTMTGVFREMEMLKRLSHPAIPQILDVFIHEPDKELCIIMEYAKGISLAEMAEQGSVELEDLFLWAIQLCDILQFLHQQSPPVIFRDVKPGHVIVDQEGQLHLIDFGIARYYIEGKKRDTELLGTKGYAAPEQYGNRQTDQRSDIYAFGMTMKTLMAVCDVPASGNEAKKYQKLKRIIWKCIEIAPEKRFQSCRKLKHALEKTNQSYSIQKFQKQCMIACVLVFFFLGFLGSIFIQGTSAFQTEQTYDQLIQVSGSYQSRIENYEKAIQMKPEDTRAYMRLLEAYEEDGTFTNEESEQITSYIEQYRTVLKNSSGYEELIYLLGKMYVHLYLEEDNFEHRLMMSYSWFREIEKQQPKARQYIQLATFYRDYILPGVEREQPGEEEYLSFLEANKTCLRDIRRVEDEIGAYQKLVFLDEIGKMIYMQRIGMFHAGVSEDNILVVLGEIEQQAYETEVTRKECIELQQDTLQRVKEYQEGIRWLYK